MRTFLLTILTSFFLFSTTELHQFLKLPLLLEHYREHRHSDPALSLLAFLQLHYSTGHPLDNDDEDDNELPFKATEAIGHIDSTVTMARPESGQRPEFPAIINQISHPEGKPCHRVYTIFRPPQAA
ncbi:MAG: hypothetical protein HZA79_16510 [Sphingobacteriales bacterium]|nr:hypothetical protein [Sphingobacteriales bacterium]